MPTFVRATTVNSNGSTSHVITLDASPASGNALIYVGQAFASVTSVTDNGGATPTYDSDHSHAANNGNIVYYSRRNITDSPTTVTINLGSSTSVRGFIVELSGLPDTGYVGQTGAGDTGTFTDSPSVSVTTATANELGIAYLVIANSRTVTTAAGWTLDPVGANPSSEGFMLYDEDVGAAGTVTCNPTLDTGTNPYFAMVTYVAASSGSAGQRINNGLIR